METRLRMPPDIVIRPSGVWNSRAPLHNFMQEHNYQLRTWEVLNLSINRLRGEIMALPDKSISGKSFFQVKKHGLWAHKSWKYFRKTLSRSAGTENIQPTAEHVHQALSAALYDIRESIIIKYVASFETFFHCWILNYLLNKLEAGEAWSVEERKMAIALSPVHSSKYIPGWPQLLDFLPLLKSELIQRPHIATNAETDELTDEPISNVLNAYETLRFWREFRNKVVHSGNIISLDFFQRWHVFFEQLRRPYANHMKPFKTGKRLLFYDSTVRAMISVHLTTAIWMNQSLKKTSDNRRCHPFAPGPEKDDIWSEFKLDSPPPPLLLDGDHEPSFLWITSEDYRQQLWSNNGQ